MPNTSSFPSVSASSRKLSIERLEDRILMSADVGIILGSLNDQDSAQHLPGHSDDLTFAQNFSSSHSLILDGHGAVVFEGGLDVHGDLVLTHASSVTFKGKVTVSGSVIIGADEVDFLGGAGSAEIGGDLTLHSGAPMHVGFATDVVGSFGLTDSDLAAVHAGGKLAIASTGDVLIDSAVFQNDVAITGSNVTVEHSLVAPGSHLALTADGIVRNDGMIDVSATASAGHAGTVVLVGGYVGNFGTILAKGFDTTPGGSVKMNSTTQTVVGSAATIDVSGGTSGGTIALWSDTNTTMAGYLTARGGPAGGHGGFVEVSSAGGFSLTGQVDTTAAAGKTGMLLLDPKNVIIAAAGTGTLAGVDQFSDTQSTDVTIAASTITSALSGVTIQANKDITVNAALSMGQDLTLLAGRSVLINQNITLANKALTIVANDAAGIDSYRDVGDAMLTTASGVVLSAGSGTIDLTLAVGDAGPAGGITIDKVITTGTLNISTAGFVHETAGDAAPSAGAMTSDDDLTAGTLNLIALSANASFGEALDQPNGALEVAAGVINADVQLPGGAPASDFAGSFVLTDADHTNGSPGGTNPVTKNAPMTIGTFNAGSGTVVLTAKGGSILGTAGATPNITAGQLNLVTETFAGPDLDIANQPIAHYGAIGSSSAPLRTEVGALTATATDGGLYISEATGVMLNKIIVQDKGVSPQIGANGTVLVGAGAGNSSAVITAGGDLVVVNVQVANQLSLTSGGMILDGNQDAANIVARGLTMTAAGEIGDTGDALETSVMTLQATTTDGGVFISESDGANVSSITAGGSGWDVNLSTSSGSLTLGAITAAGGNVTVSAASGAITDGNGAATNITAATATLAAQTNLGTATDALEVNVGGLSTKVTNASAGTYATSTGTLSTLAIETNNGAVGLTLSGGAVGFVQPGSKNELSLAAPGMNSFTFTNSGGSVAIKSIDVGTGTVNITAKTFISDFANDTILNLKAGTATLKAGTYVGQVTNALETDVDNLSVSADAGGIFIADAGSIASLDATAKGTGNDITVTTVGDLVVAKVAAPDVVTLTSATGSILRSGSVLNVSGAGITLQAGGAIGTSAEPLILGGTLNSAQTAAGGIFLKSKGTLAATSVKAIGGNIELAADKDITLGLVETDSSHAVKLTSTYGGILDGNGTAVNIRAGTANLTAVKIGVVNDAVDTDVDTITALGTSGGIYLNEISGVNVQRLEAQGLGSDISFTAAGDIVLGVAKADGDKVSLKSTGGAISDGNGPALNISADQLDISATLGIGTLQNSVNKLGSANGGAGGVTISNLGALAVLESTLEGRGPGKLTIEADSITILDIADNEATLDRNGSLQLTARTGNVVFLDPNDTIAASGTGSIGISAGLGLTPAYPNTGAVAAIGNLTTQGGSIKVVANHHITIGLLNTGGTGDVTVASETGVILDGNGAAPNIIGNTVTLSGQAQDTRLAQLESTIRIADYSAIRSEAAAKLTNAQSMATATAIMLIQKNNALDAEENAIDNEAEALAAKKSADRAADSAYAFQKILEATSIALSLVRNGVEVAAGFAQAIPFSGDGGASGAWAILDLAANIADAAAFAQAIKTDNLKETAEARANDYAQAGAETTALTATYLDSLATWTAFNEGTSVAQKAADAAAIARDHSLVVRNQAIAAEDQVNVIGTGANPLGIQAQHLYATAQGGSVYLGVTGTLELGGISATGAQGVVSIDATGDIRVTGSTTAPTQVSLHAGGSIVDGGGTIETPKFLGTAQSSVGTVASPIHTTVSTVAVKALGGTAGISNTGALEIGSLGGIDGVTATSNVAITSTDSLTLQSAISAPGQTVTLRSQNGAIIDAHTGVDVKGLTLNATSATGMKLDTDITNLTARTTGAGSIDIHEADGITLTSVQTANGAIAIEAGGTIVATTVASQTDADANGISLKATNGGHIQAGSINAGSTAGDITLNAGGSITMLGGGRLISDGLTATAHSGIDITTTINSADLSVSEAGNLTVHQSGALVVNHMTTANGAIDLTAGAVTLGEGAINAAGGASDVTIHAAGAISGPLTSNNGADVVGAIVNLVTTGIGNQIGASTANRLEINATSHLDVQTQNGNAFITDVAGGVVVGLANTGLGDFHLAALAGSINSLNQGDGIADIVAAHVDLKVTGVASKIGSSEASTLDIDGSTLTVQTDGGSAYLTDTDGGIALNTLDVATGDLYLTANNGAITDNDASAENNIVATKLMLAATAGIGTSANPIESTVTNFEGDGGTGGVYLTDLVGGIIVGGVTGTRTGVSASGGDIVLTTFSPLTVNEAISNTGGDITLTATDKAAAGDDLTINADLTASNITLQAGDNLTLASGATVTAAGGTVKISADHGDADAGVGSTIQLSGAIRAESLEITSAGDGDTLNLQDAVVSSTRIDTGAGHDKVTIAAGNSLGDSTLATGEGNDLVEISAAVGTFNGGSGDDTLLVKNGGSISVAAKGGEGHDKFIYDHDGLGGDDFVGPVTVNLQTKSADALAAFEGIEHFEGTSNPNDHLVGADVPNTWHITGANAGDIGGTGALEFSGFEHLTGGAQDDVFQFAEHGQISGDLDGGASMTRNTIDYQGSHFHAPTTVVLDGPAGGTTSAIGGRFDHVNEVISDPDYAAANSFTGNDAPNTWTFTGAGSGHINNAFFFSGFGAITGGSSPNTFAYGDHVIPAKPVVGGPGNNILDLSAWTGDIRWNITGNNSGNVVTSVGTFEFSGMTTLIGGSGNDRFTFSDDQILGKGLGSPGSIVGNGGTDFLDLSAYTKRNLWSRTNSDGSIETDRGAWSYSSIEQYLGGEPTTYLFDVVDFTGAVTKVSLPAQLLPGQTGSVAMTVTNNGNDEVFRKQINVSFYLSLDGKVDRSDVLIGNNDGRGINLYQGHTSHAFATNATIPLGTAPGSYHLLASIDSGNVVAEADETNNVIDGGTIEVLPVLVDLQPVVTKTTLPAQVLPGAKGVVTTVVTNHGNSPAKGAVDVEYFLSLDDTIGAGDIPLGGNLGTTLNLAGGASKTFTFTAQIPAGTPVGDYHVLARVDSQNALLESHVTNKLAATPATVHVDQPFVDLVAAVENAKLPTIAIPNDTFTFQVPIKNAGNIAANGKIDVDFYLSADGTLEPGTDVLLKSMKGVSINLAPNGERVLTVTGTVPASILGGTFHVLADVDSHHALNEANETNNTAVSVNDMEVVWRFGNFGDRKNVKLVVPDANGNIVTFSMTGEGAGDVLGGSSFREISLVGTNDQTWVNVKTKGNAITQLHDITATNGLGRFVAPKAAVQGDVNIAGAIRLLQLGDVTGPSSFTIGDRGYDGIERVIVRLGHVQDLNFTSKTPIKSLTMLDWKDTDTAQETITAPWIRAIISSGDFQSDIVATGTDVWSESLYSLRVKGIATSNVTLAGGAGSIAVGGWSGGSFTGAFGGVFTVGGALQHTTFNFTGAVPSTTLGLTSLRVGGAVTDSLIHVQQDAGYVSVGTWGAGSVLAVGVTDGGDGTYFDGNESAVGGKLAGFKSNSFATANGGTDFGIAVDNLTGLIQLNAKTKYRQSSLPIATGDLKLVLL